MSSNLIAEIRLSASKEYYLNASVLQSTLIALGVNVPLTLYLLVALSILTVRPSQRRKHRSTSLGTTLQEDDIDDKRSNFESDKKHSEIMSEGEMVRNELPSVDKGERSSYKKYHNGRQELRSGSDGVRIHEL